jgi:hypothetical protein
MSTDWRQWAKATEPYCIYFSEYDMVAGSFGGLKGMDVDVYMYFLLQEFGFMKTEKIPSDYRDMVKGWPKVSICCLLGYMLTRS